MTSTRRDLRPEEPRHGEVAADGRLTILSSDTAALPVAVGSYPMELPDPDPQAPPAFRSWLNDPERRGRTNPLVVRARDEAALARSVLRTARFGVWAIPLAAICLALSGLWGWPSPAPDGGGGSGPRWMLITVVALALGLFGLVSLAVVVAASRGAKPAVAAVVATVLGTVVFAPIVGLVGVARPVVPDTSAQLADSAAARWLTVGGLVLLALGWVAAAAAVVATPMLSPVDGALIVIAVALAVASAYLSWHVLLVFSAFILLAAGLGIAWSISRLTPESRLA